MNLEVTLAGAVSIRLGDRRVGPSTFGPGQLRLVTAMLVLERDDPVSVDALAAELWPEQPPDQWRVAVRGLVGRLRRHLLEVGLDGNPIRGERGRYVVDLPHVRVDVESALRQLAEARASLDGGDHERGRELAADARAVLSRPVLPGVDSPWADRLRDRLAAAHVETLVLLGRARARLGGHVEARSVLSEALRLDPLREDAWRALMRAETAAGNAAGALRAFEQCRATLADELGVDPSEATQRLHAEILHSIPDPDTVATPTAMAVGVGHGAVTEREPYVGLRAFRQNDADLFFGRTGEVQELVTRLARHGIVAVVGPSGVGKSSLVRAGLLPALATGAIPESDTWVPIVMTPGSEPLKSLAVELAHASAELLVEDVADLLATDEDGLHQVAGRLVADRGPAARVLLVVDQLEEMFTLGDLARAETLTRVLLTAVGRLDRRVVVVVTLRADFYDRTSEVTGLADLLSWSQYVVPVLTGEQVEAVVTGPASRVGVKLEAGLLGQILTGVAGEPGSLPMLQHLLLELWRQRTSDVMTRGAYDDLGGVAGALAQRAEAVYMGLGEDDQGVARRVLLRGVQPGDDTGDARRPVRAGEWAGPDDDPNQVEKVVSRLVDARLLTATHDLAFGERTVELAHEALIDGWPRLRTWVDEARGWLLDHRRLTVAADEWERHDRHDDWLLAGMPLDEADSLLVADDRGDVDLHLSSAERDLVVASLEARERARAEEAAREAHERLLERRSLQRMRALVAVLVLAALLGTGLSAVALGQRGEARTQARLATVRALVSGASEQLDQDPELALLLALEGVGRTQAGDGTVRRDAEQVLHDAVAVASRIERVLPGVGGRVAWSPTGDMVAALSAEEAGRVELYDPDSGELRATLDHESEVYGLAFAPDGSTLATGGADGTLRLWDAETGTAAGVLEGPESEVRGPSFSPDGTMVAASWQEAGRALVWDVGSGARIANIHVDEQTGGTAFNPDGTQLLVMARMPGAVGVVVDVAAAMAIFAEGRDGLGDAELFRLQGELLILWSPEGAWSPDGRWIASASGRVWDADTGEPEFDLVTSDFEAIEDVAWSSDGGRLVGVHVDGATVIWDTAETPFTQVLRLPGQTSLSDVAVSASGEHVLTGGAQRTAARIWDISPLGSVELANAESAPEFALDGFAVSPDGTRVADHLGKGFLRVRDSATLDELWRVSAHEPVLLDNGFEFLTVPNIEWSADGSLVATGGADQTAVWDADTGARKFTVDLEPLAMTPAFHPDSQHVAVDRSRDVVVLDRDGDEVAVLPQPQEIIVEGMAFSPDGRHLVVAQYTWPPDHEFEVVVWDWREREVVRTLPTEAWNIGLAPTGTLLVTADANGIAEIWDWERGELVRRLVGHSNDIQHAQFNADGSMIATGGHDGTLRVWDTETGTQVLRLGDFDGFTHRVRFDPQGRWVAAIGLIGDVNVIRFFTLDLDELVRIARGHVTRSLTDEECVEYLPAESCRVA